MKIKLSNAIQSKVDALYDRTITAIENFYMAINDMLLEGARINRSKKSSSQKRTKRGQHV